MRTAPLIPGLLCALGVTCACQTQVIGSIQQHTSCGINIAAARDVTVSGNTVVCNGVQPQIEALLRDLERKVRQQNSASLSPNEFQEDEMRIEQESEYLVAIDNELTQIDLSTSAMGAIHTALRDQKAQLAISLTDSAIQKSNDNTDQVAALNFVEGCIWSLTGDRRATEAFELATNVTNSLKKVRYGSALSVSLLFFEDYKEARMALIKTLNSLRQQTPREREEDGFMEPVILNNLGLAEGYLQQFDEALKHFQIADEILTKENSPESKERQWIVLENEADIMLKARHFPIEIDPFGKEGVVQEKLKMRDNLLATYTNAMEDSFRRALGILAELSERERPKLIPLAGALATLNSFIVDKDARSNLEFAKSYWRLFEPAPGDRIGSIAQGYYLESLGQMSLDAATMWVSSLDAASISASYREKIELVTYAKEMMSKASLKFMDECNREREATRFCGLQKTCDLGAQKAGQLKEQLSKEQKVHENMSGG